MVTKGRGTPSAWKLMPDIRGAGKFGREGISQLPLWGWLFRRQNRARKLVEDRRRQLRDRIQASARRSARTSSFLANLTAQHNGRHRSLPESMLPAYLIISVHGQKLPSRISESTIIPLNSDQSTQILTFLQLPVSFILFFLLDFITINFPHLGTPCELGGRGEAGNAAGAGVGRRGGAWLDAP